MKLYNTLTREKQIFKPLNPLEVKVYMCGPTVYWYPHIGNMRTYVNNDILVRTLKFNGFNVKTVMNITDVGHLVGDRDMGEDKMEKTARENRVDIWSIAKKYTSYFFKATKLLNIKKPDIVCKATDYIKEMIDLVKILEEKGFTYKTKDGVYFNTSKLKDYGKLVGFAGQELKEGARVEKNPEKKNPTDFALWKFAKRGEKRQMEWDSPWGKHSFPGWHIECSVMAMENLGEQIDIHTGGIEHIPVHHTNEIAQSEAVTGRQFVKYWFHSNHLLVNGKKMSKSLKNIFTLNDVVEKGFEPLALRYFFLTAHYKSKLNFTWKALKGAQKSLNNLRQLLKEEVVIRKKSKQASTNKVEDYKTRFLEAVNNDLNISKALAVVWKAFKDDLALKDKTALAKLWDEVLGLDLVLKKEAKIPDKVKKLVKKREDLRKDKRWQEADKIRKEIKTLGWEVEDVSKKTIVKKKV
jgi:cysteinyl-tRNA synthetase